MVFRPCVCNTSLTSGGPLKKVPSQRVLLLVLQVQGEKHICLHETFLSWVSTTTKKQEKGVEYSHSTKLSFKSICYWGKDTANLASALSSQHPILQPAPDQKSSNQIHLPNGEVKKLTWHLPNVELKKFTWQGVFDMNWHLVELKSYVDKPRRGQTKSESTPAASDKFMEKESCFEYTPNLEAPQKSHVLKFQKKSRNRIGDSEFDFTMMIAFLQATKAESQTSRHHKDLCHHTSRQPRYPVHPQHFGPEHPTATSPSRQSVGKCRWLTKKLWYNFWIFTECMQLRASHFKSLLLNTVTPSMAPKAGSVKRKEMVRRSDGTSPVHQFQSLA